MERCADRDGKTDAEQEHGEGAAPHRTRCSGLREWKSVLSLHGDIAGQKWTLRTAPCNGEIRNAP